MKSRRIIGLAFLHRAEVCYLASEAYLTHQGLHPIRIPFIENKGGLLADRVRYCSASECRLSGELRKWLARDRKVEDDPQRHFTAVN